MKLTCKDIDPTSDCHFEATGSTRAETAGKMIEHAKEVHGDKVAQMAMSDDEMMKVFESKVRE